MRKRKMIAIIFTILVTIGVVWPRKASAYLDPGSGSYLIQIIIAGMVGFGFFFRNYWQQVKIFFKKKSDD